MKINIDVPDDVHILAKINATKLSIFLKKYYIAIIRRGVNVDRETLKMVDPDQKCEIDNEGYVTNMEERK